MGVRVRVAVRVRRAVGRRSRPYRLQWGLGLVLRSGLDVLSGAGLGLIGSNGGWGWGEGQG
eukprot:scaffold79741_cov50-Phaeocystis_antarctica.AAC.8